MPIMRQAHLTIVSCLCVHFAASLVWAVKAETWVHEQPSDFTSGEFDNVVVTNDGEVMLGRQIDTLYVPGKEAEIVNALARAADGQMYAATGPSGIIYRIGEDNKVTEFARLPEGGTALSLLFDQAGHLLVGTGGGVQARIYALDGNGKVTLFYEPPGARYIWAMVRGSAGEIYAATGVEGKLYVVNADGTNGRELADLKPKNILCLAYGQEGMLYGGTDEDGLICRINPASGKSYVLYDATEPEISSIVVDGAGNVFAATADASSAKPGRAVADVPGGKPDRSAATQAATQPAAQTRPPGTGTAPAKGETESGKDQPDTKEADDTDGEEQAKAALAGLLMAKHLGRSVPSTGKSGSGNAIYRVDTDGFVTEVFREPVMILAMAEAQGTIYAATGNEGRLYAITPGQDAKVALAKLKANQATALLRLPKGGLIVGTANEAMIVKLSDGYATKGTLESKPLDAGQIVKWGRLTWEATVPEGSKLSVATRSGNVEDKESNAWEEWSQEADATAPQQISSAGARFLQYRLTFESTATEATPRLRRLRIARIEENRPPVMNELKVVSVAEAAKDPASPPKVKSLASGAFGGGEPKPETNWVVMWKAEDPNKDTLEYEVFFRERGTNRWVRMAKEVKEPFHVWDTQTVPDGRYEVRVVSSDRLSNPAGDALSDARISEGMVVDNTPPEVTIGAVTPGGTGQVTVSASLSDALSPLAEASYTVDSDEEWQTLAALDDIFDSPNESVSFTIRELSPGEHRLALRVRDQQGNTRYATKTIIVSE